MARARPGGGWSGWRWEEKLGRSRGNEGRQQGWGQKTACFPHLLLVSLTRSLHLSVCVSASLLCLCRSLPGTSTPPAIAATPVSAIPAALGVNGYSPVPTQPAGQPAPDALYPNGVHPYPGGAPCLPVLPHLPLPACSGVTGCFPLASGQGQLRLKGPAAQQTQVFQMLGALLPHALCILPSNSMPR